MKDMTTIPRRALILCADPRLSRLVEIELSYLGISSQVEGKMPKSWEGVCLLVADGDEFPVADCRAEASVCGCPLLLFGREEISLPPEEGVYLRRPFGLDQLAEAVRMLSGSPVLSLRADAPIPSGDLNGSVQKAPVSLLTVQDGVVTLAGKTVLMTPAEAEILAHLYARPGETVPREELASLLGGGGNILDVYICRLRSKIEAPLGRRIIWTVRGKGYVLKTEI